MTTTSTPAVELPAYDPDERWWQPDPATRVQAKQVARALDTDELISLRLTMLGADAQQVADYLNPTPKLVRHPEDTCVGMTAAARALSDAIDAGELIAIYGDYDVDGATSLAITRDALESYGARVFVGSANAVSGFGLTRAFVEAARDAGARWLVTVDCGSTQVQPVKLAQSYGMRVVVVDHHDVDDENPAEHHLNPRLSSVLAMRQLRDALESSRDPEGPFRVKARQKLTLEPPFSEQLVKLTEISMEVLAFAFGAVERDWLIAEAQKPISNTGSVLSWKLAASLHTVRLGRCPASHWGRAMYMAGLGAIADMAPSDDPEVRAFVRVSTDLAMQRSQFENRRVVPRGIELLTDLLGEDPLRMDSMIRSRALMNLPKRTSQIDAADIQKLLRSEDEVELRRLVPRLVADYERISAIRRDQMDPIVLEQVGEAAARGENTYFAYGVVDREDLIEYAGYSRMSANSAAKATGKPAIVFTRKTTADMDEFGQELFKFSGANNSHPEAHLGELIADKAMRAACQVAMRDWLGEPALIENLGGHVEVVSGVCTRENIPHVIAACEAWAAVKEKKRLWRPAGDKRPRVIARKVGAAHFARLEREAPLLAPFSFPEAPSPMVSVTARFSDLEVRDDGRTHAIMTIDGTLDRAVTLHAEAEMTIRAYPKQTWEAVVALGSTGPYFVKHLVAC